MPTSPQTVLVLLFDEVEVLDFAGPFEVFSVARDTKGDAPFRVRTVGMSAAIAARGGLRITPDHTIEDPLPADVVVVPGGPGIREVRENGELRTWLERHARSEATLLSVCTGALLLARAGLLDGRRVTTHHENLDELRRAAPRCEVVEGERWVDGSSIVTAAGVSAGIEAALHLVSRLAGASVADRTARYIEYPYWAPAPE